MTPASIRNNHPGAMYPGKSSKKFGSTSYETLKSKDGVHKIATFPTSTHGAAAQFDLLARVYTGMTLEKAVTKWCGGFYAPTYLKVLKDRADVTPETVLTKAMLADYEFAIPFAKAMAWQEAGRDFPLKDEDWLEAHQMAMGKESTAPAWNPRNDVPTPKLETRQEPLWRRIKLSVTGFFGSIGTYGVLGPTGIDVLPVVPPPPAGIKQTVSNLGQWGDAVPWQQWQMLALGAGVFGAVAVGSLLMQKVRG
jgi:hypothetical protein